MTLRQSSVEATVSLHKEQLSLHKEPSSSVSNVQHHDAHEARRAGRPGRMDSSGMGLLLGLVPEDCDVSARRWIQSPPPQSQLNVEMRFFGQPSDRALHLGGCCL